MGKVYLVDSPAMSYDHTGKVDNLQLCDRRSLIVCYTQLIFIKLKLLIYSCLGIASNMCQRKKERQFPKPGEAAVQHIDFEMVDLDNSSVADFDHIGMHES